MKVLDHFSIPYQGLKNGLHSYQFDVDAAFFNEFENSPISNGEFVVNLELDKRSDLAIAEFDFNGTVTVNCGRCLADFDMPMDGEYTLHIKYGEAIGDEDEVMFVDPDVSSINFAQFIYESICISLPMVVLHPDLRECDPEIIRRMSFEEEAEKSTNEIWKDLKGLNIEHND